MYRKALGVLSGALLVCAFGVAVPSTHADAANEATEFTFGEAVALPGNVVLPAGTYWFVMPEPMIAQNVIQVRDSKRTDVVTSFVAIPTERMKTTDDTQLTFVEQSGKRPIALMDWYYPGTVTGHELVFSARKEAQLNEDSHITLQVKPGSEARG